MVIQRGTHGLKAEFDRSRFVYRNNFANFENRQIGLSIEYRIMNKML